MLLSKAAATRALLLFTGATSLTIGAAITFATVPFYASSGVDLGGNAHLLSEIRSTGATLMAVALYLLTAAFRPTWWRPALVVTGVYFGAYGAARLYSGLTTGWPGPELNAALVVELAVCAAALALLRTSGTSGQPKLA